jgi:hypothetical protein
MAYGQMARDTLRPMAELMRASAVEATIPGAIQQAVDRLPDGGLVQLAPGEFHVDKTIALHDGITVEGAGVDATTLVLDPGANCHIFSNRNHTRGNANIALRGFTIDGTSADQHHVDRGPHFLWGCGALFRRVRNVAVHDLMARNVGQTVLFFNRCEAVRVRSVLADHIGWAAVSANQCVDVALKEIAATDVGRDGHSGIHLDGNTGTHIDATIDGCAGNAIMLSTRSRPMSDVTINGTYTRALRGISIGGSDDHELSNVVISGDYSRNRECGVFISHASHVRVADATIASNDVAGIIIQGADSRDCTVTDCQIADNPTPVIERRGATISHLASRR